MGRVQAGFGKRKEIFKSLMRLKESGKEIIVFCEKNDISNMDYYIISMADYIYTTPHTSVDLKGINMEMTFLKRTSRYSFHCSRSSQNKSLQNCW